MTEPPLARPAGVTDDHALLRQESRMSEVFDGIGHLRVQAGH
ncbi:hypothetical protein [Sphaerisporangium album]|nr:hypothetical protein [Sphaerisporangium album]